VIDVAAIKSRFEAVAPFLDERGRRLVAASEALTAGRGGVKAVCEATAVARSTIGRGLAELRGGENHLGGRVRRAGGGRKAAIERQAGLLETLAELVQSAIRGDPQAALLWVSKSQRHLAGALAERGFVVSHKLVGRLLRRLGFTLQSNRKTREGASHPDRDAQFEHINTQVSDFQAAGQPAISVDTKKKELVGDFRNSGRELRPKGEPERVRVHDFKIPELGKVAPYGIYDIAANTGWVNVGIDHDTAAFADEVARAAGKHSLFIGEKETGLPMGNPVVPFETARQLTQAVDFMVRGYRVPGNGWHADLFVLASGRARLGRGDEMPG